MRRRTVLLALILAGLLLRLLYLRQVAALPFFDHPVGDSAVHLRRAAEILDGRLLPERAFFYGSPLYPYFLAVVLALPGGGPFLAALVQTIAGAGLVGLIGRLGRRAFGRAAGLAAAAMAALYGPFAFLEADVLGVVWALVGVTAGALWCLQWAGRAAGAGAERRAGLPAWRYLPAAGLAFGLAAAERPNLAVLAPLAALWCAGTALRAGTPERRGGRALVSAALLAAGAAGGVAPVFLLGRAASGTWSPMTSTGINLYIGNHEGARGTFDEPWSARDTHFTARYTDLEQASLRRASMEAGRDLTPAEASAHWTGRALAWIASSPSGFARVTLRKAALLLNAAEIPNHLDYGVLREWAPALRSMPVGFGVVGPLAAAGFVLGIASLRRRGAAAFLLLVAAASAVSLLPFFIADRYRAPLLPPLVAAAGAGLVGLVRAAFRRGTVRVGALAGALGAGLAALVLAFLPLANPDRSRDAWLLAQAYRAEGDLAAALSAYEAALRTSGEDGVLLNNVGTLLRAMGRRAEAEAAFRRAIRADAGLAYPRKNLGLLLMAEGRGREALASIADAIRIDGEDTESLGAAAALLAEEGREEEARARYAEARRLDPSDPRLARLLVRWPWLGSPPATSPPATP